MTTRRIAAVLLAVLLIAAAVPAPAAAQSDDASLFDTTVDAAKQVLSNPSAALDGIQARLFGDEPDVTAAEAEKQVRTYFNNRSAEFQQYAVDHRLTGAESRDVVRIVYKIDGESASHIAQATVKDGEYQNPEIVASTSRTVDVECTLEENAARNAPDELATIYEDYVQPGKTNTSDLETRLATQYAGSVSCTEVSG